MSITTRKTYPFRSFYKGKQRSAFYVINIIGEESQITIYSDYIKGVDSLGLRKSSLEMDRFKAYELLRQHFPEGLADAIMKYAMKDLGVEERFSLQSYAKWKINR